MSEEQSINYQQAINLAIITVVCGIVTSTLTETIKNIISSVNPYFCEIYKWLSDKIFGPKSTIVVKSYLYMHNVNCTSFERFIITYIANKIKMSGNVVECVTNSSEVNYLPTNQVTYEGITYQYIEESPSDSYIKQGYLKHVKLYLDSYKYNNDELAKIVQEYRKKYDRIATENVMVYLDEIEDDHPFYSVYDFKYSGGLSDIHNSDFREIFKIYLNKYLANEIPRINVLLYGPPGTGKTTIIKRIASEIKAVIYAVKLSQFDTINKLRKFMFSKTNTCINHRDHSYTTVKPNHIINIFEDFDADISSILAVRDPDEDKMTISKKHKAKESNDDEDTDDEDYGPTKKSHRDVKWKLDDILNLLDGTLPLSRVINIFTTNCIDKIDPAFYRPGRMDICMEIGGLNFKDAVEYINGNSPWKLCKLATERLKKCCPIKISVLQEEISRVDSSDEFLNTYAGMNN